MFGDQIIQRCSIVFGEIQNLARGPRPVLVKANIFQNVSSARSSQIYLEEILNSPVKDVFQIIWHRRHSHYHHYQDLNTTDAPCSLDSTRTLSWMCTMRTYVSSFLWGLSTMIDEIPTSGGKKPSSQSWCSLVQLWCSDSSLYSILQILMQAHVGYQRTLQKGSFTYILSRPQDGAVWKNIHSQDINPLEADNQCKYNFLKY